eukprot:COSAG01_NODE_7212_length_3303_cov_3.954432_2_plen_86_part_00
MRGCPLADARLLAIAADHAVSAAQVCVRWALQRGAIAALGTGSNASTVGGFTRENLGVWDFQLTRADMSTINMMAAPSDHHRLQT